MQDKIKINNAINKETETEIDLSEDYPLIFARKWYSVLQDSPADASRNLNLRKKYSIGQNIQNDPTWYQNSTVNHEHEINFDNFMENKETPNINLTPIVDRLVKNIKPTWL